MNFARVQTHRSGEVEVSAADYWAMLTDWPAVKTWMPSENAPVPLVKCELRPGHAVGTLPCTRDCYFGGTDGATVPSVVSETLLHVDPGARTIYYNIEGEGPHGLRNYLATTTVDAIGDGRARVTCIGRFDLPDASEADVARALIEAVYEHAIIRGIEAAVLRAA